MREHDPVMVALSIAITAALGNAAVSYEMKLGVRRVIPKDQFPRARSRNDWKPQLWLLRTHRSMYPGDVLPTLYQVLTGMIVLSLVFLLLEVLAAR